MLCYRDMTFCRFYNGCTGGTKCGRALTPKIRAEAKGFGLPIGQFCAEPNCYESEIEEMLSNVVNEIVDGGE